MVYAVSNDLLVLQQTIANSTLLTADMILLCMKKPIVILTHLTSCTATTSKLHSANWLLTSHVPNLIFIFRYIGHSKEPVQFLGTL